MSGRNGVARLLVALVVTSASCRRLDVSRAPGPPPSASGASARDIEHEIPSTPIARELTTWRALVRDEQWDAAWRALSALSDQDKSRPELRYVRARVALARGDGAAALPLFDGLEALLPLLASDVERRRAEARFAAGGLETAGGGVGARSGPAAPIYGARPFGKG